MTTESKRISFLSVLVAVTVIVSCLGCNNDHRPEVAATSVDLSVCSSTPSELLAWWGGDGSGAQLAGTYPMVYDGADYVPGKVTQAFHFDGINYGTLGPVTNRIDLAPKPGFTLAAWIKKGATSTQSIMDERDAARHFEWRVLSSGLLEYSVAPSSLVSTVAVADNQWHFVVLTHDKATQVAKIYVDGMLNATGTGKRYSYAGLLTSVNGFGLTRRSSAGLDMDEVMVFGRALDATEIAGLYNAGDGGGCKPTGYPVCGNAVVESSASYGNAEECDDGNLAIGDGCDTVCKTEHAVISHVISWWKLDEGTGLATDDFIDGNNGVLTSTSVWGTGAPNFGGGIGPSTNVSQSARVDVADRPNQHLDKNPFTITFWVNARTGISLSHRWFEKQNLHGTVSARSPDGFQCCGDIKVGLGGATNDIYFQAGRTTIHDVHATVPIVGTGWRHIAAVREIDGTLRIYVDCVLKASRLNTAAVEPILNVTNRGGIVLGSGLSSQLDEVKLIDKALSSSEVCDDRGGSYPPDACPNDPNKIAPGICGCGVPDADSDNDGTADCLDSCPADPVKTSPGVCGCGAVDSSADSDADGTVDCLDGCSTDPAKTSPGVCGCGVSDVDSDADGAANCNDACPSDPNKVAAGVCGCGVLDTDTDGDGTADCNETCDTDPAKTSPGVCGCGVSDVDSDADGTADCNDMCPNDPNKVVPGTCGCSVVDSDSDGVCDNVDYCLGTNLGGPIPTVSLNPNQVGDDNLPNGNNPGFNFGCNCTQVLDQCYNGSVLGQRKFGCTRGTVNVFNSRTGWASDSDSNGRPDCLEAYGASGGETPLIPEGDLDGDGVINVFDVTPDDSCTATSTGLEDPLTGAGDGNTE